MERIGRGWMDEAEKRYAREEYVEALDGFRRVLAVFIGLPVAKAARLRISEVESDPEVQAAIKEVTAARMFAQLARMLGTTTAPTTRAAAAPAVTAGAILAMKDDRILRAIDTLDSIIRTCRGAPTAGKAHELRRQLRSDPKADARLTRLIRGRLATRALNKARTYHQAGMHTKAIALYRGVIQDFGGTARAAEAAVLLETLEVASPGR